MELALSPECFEDRHSACPCENSCCCPCHKADIDDGDVDMSEKEWEEIERKSENGKHNYRYV